MTLTFKVDIPKNFSQKEKDEFLTLLIEQDQVENPTLDKINFCPLLCIVCLNEKPVAIGAIKQVYKAPFAKAGVSKLQDEYDDELGYVYVTNNKSLNLRGLGLGTTICKMLLKELNKIKIFATIENSENNYMQNILVKLGFNRIGNTYLGNKTKKNISLFIKG